MAFTSKDGKKRFGSAYVAKRYDENHPSEEKNAGAEHEEMKETPEQEMKETPMEEKKEEKEGTEEHPVVTEHGPAHTVHIKHDHTAKRHHVTSHHNDGHVHESEHATPDEAHSEAAKLAGITEGGRDLEQEQEPMHMSGSTHDEEGFPNL